MSLGSREIAVFVLDASPTMRKEAVLLDAEGEEQLIRPLDAAVRYVNSKIAQRLMRELKTTPMGVLGYGLSNKRSSNVLTAEKQAHEDYDASDDGYVGYHELVPITYDMDPDLLDTLAGDLVTHDPTPNEASGENDGLSAIVLALETIKRDSKSKNYGKKDIFLLTDGESSTNWDGLDDIVSELKSANVTVTVVGFNFDEDDEDGFKEIGKSDTKAHNEAQYKILVEGLGENSSIATMTDALASIDAPRIKETRSNPEKSIPLYFGDPTDETSLRIFVDVKKATTPASLKSMQKMSMLGFERGGKMTASQPGKSQTHKDDPRVIRLGAIGRLYEDELAQDGLKPIRESDRVTSVAPERATFYKSAPEIINDEDAHEEDEKEGLVATDGAELKDAYYFGGTLVEIDVDADDDDEKDPDQTVGPNIGRLKGLQNQMEIINFLKASDVRYDWRLNDPRFVYAAEGQIGSQALLSTFINALIERDMVALVRYVGKGMNSTQKNGEKIFRFPDPKIGILFPVREDPVEFFYWIQMPFEEDVREIGFPSLTRMYNKKDTRLTEHRFIPTSEQNQVMDDLVDAMDISAKEGEDEFFTAEESFSPAIHTLQNTLVFRLSDPAGELPPVAKAITKYMFPPREVVEQAEEAIQRAIDAFAVKIVPPKPKRIQKRETDNFPREDAPEVNLEDIFGGNDVDMKVEEEPDTE